MRFKKDDKIKFEKKLFKCIISDKDVAVFAALKIDDLHDFVDFERLFAVKNFVDDETFVCEKLDKEISVNKIVP